MSAIAAKYRRLVNSFTDARIEWIVAARILAVNKDTVVSRSLYSDLFMRECMHLTG